MEMAARKQKADCHNPFIAFVEPVHGNRPARTDANAVGAGEGRFQVRTNPNGGTNPCLPATGHASMNVCMGDASVRSLASDMDRHAWWALLTPAGGEAGQD